MLFPTLFAMFTGCCGTIQCAIEEDGRGQCVGGSVCKSRYFTWKCGDTVVSSEKKCICGEQTLTRDIKYNVAQNNRRIY